MYRHFRCKTFAYIRCYQCWQHLEIAWQFLGFHYMWYFIYVCKLFPLPFRFPKVLFYSLLLFSWSLWASYINKIDIGLFLLNIPILSYIISDTTELKVIFSLLMNDYWQSDSSNFIVDAWPYRVLMLPDALHNAVLMFPVPNPCSDRWLSNI